MTIRNRIHIRTGIGGGSLRETQHMRTSLGALSRHASQVRKNAVRLLERGKRVPAKELAALLAMDDADTTYIAAAGAAMDAKVGRKAVKKARAK